MWVDGLSDVCHSNTFILQETMSIHTTGGPVLISSNAPRIGSPGQKNPAVESYDPSGLRSSMTATWTQLDKSLEANRPTHLVRPWWAQHIEKIHEECDRKGIPRVPGKNDFSGLPKEYYELRW